LSTRGTRNNSTDSFAERIAANKNLLHTVFRGAFYSARPFSAIAQYLPEWLSRKNAKETLMQTDEQAIRQLVRDWMTGTMENDVPRVAALMAEDVVFLVTGQPPMLGRKAFLDSLKGMLSQVDFQGSSDIQEIYVSGDLAYCWNHLTVRVTPKSGSPTRQRTGYALSILRRQSDGKWILTRDANLLGPAEDIAS
jgi:uncharacterized protein (TIGR02246 family)